MVMQNGKDHMRGQFLPPAIQLGLNHVIAHVSSPPISPANSPRHRRERSLGGRTMAIREPKVKYGSPVVKHRVNSTWSQKLTHFLLSFFRRRNRVLLFIPFIYVTGMLLYMGGDISMEFPPFPGRYRPGSVYRSDQVFEKLWPEMERADSSSYGVEFGSLPDAAGGSHGRQVLSAWEYPKKGGGFTPCLSSINQKAGLPESNGYILVEANGGLNQQRSTICNAVAVAKLMNATLIIPHFHLNSVWKDPSNFGEIFDEAHFIESLSKEVRILRDLPQELLDKFDNGNTIFKLKVKAWSLPRFYLEEALPELLEREVIRFTPFANRLAYDGIPKRIQKLRCYTNFVALRFAQPIANMGNILVKRMKAKSAKTNGNYVSIHLRFEEDMVAFSQCVYTGGEEEKTRLDNTRERGWRGKFTREGRVNASPEQIRRNGKCPLTPVEVGMMLRGMGFSNSTPIYLAAGLIYKGEESMEPLRRMFPYLQSKETLLTPEEYKQFKGFSSRLAAIDYTVCLHSEVFVTTQGGNFPQILMGHRRFLNKGHSKTINPDKRRLVLLLDNPHIEWDAFRKILVDMRRHSDFKGLQPRKSFPVSPKAYFTNPPKASVYTFPAPECMCAEPANTRTATEVLVSKA
ncbi:O-fucosyltransferase 9 [Physcomitrium patens]|uniref:O-fucosyltransferase family protein n=1 Tax=Physcomitrium patens TaxID=3218 RepID=A0A2K1IVQ8_PHYPA|nr:O-fucosyltransferase 9-like [Physcomitrium patens]XP_024358506.1 O-fucosyltransferase 9-like [Physcomitrium patens]XP_024358507.1 O-fucosyltransferase 9-like [Physcomitrium patens]PNR33362.1 hypothetical protein PHYPA_025305 [Physcomitrium patens]|eukprot:XP_024358505.1 O-fucosyltransferase 9-like [Physcomitrella patens]